MVVGIGVEGIVAVIVGEGVCKACGDCMSVYAANALGAKTQSKTATNQTFLNLSPAGLSRVNVKAFSESKTLADICRRLRSELVSPKKLSKK